MELEFYFSLNNCESLEKGMNTLIPSSYVLSNTTTLLLELSLYLEKITFY